MPNLNDLCFLLVISFPCVVSQLTLTTHTSDQCIEDVDHTQYITYLTPVEDIRLATCEPVTHSANQWNRGQVVCDGAVTVFTWYDSSSCEAGNARAYWRFYEPNAETLYTGGCAGFGGEYATFNATNDTLANARVFCLETTTTTNTTVTPHPPSPWYNPDVPGGNTTTTTTTANNNNLFFYAQDARYLNPGDHFAFHGDTYAPPGDYMFTGVATSLTTPMNIGDNFLNVGLQAGFNIGDLLLIGNTEMKTIIGFSSIILNGPLMLQHAVGESVVVLVATSGASGGDPVAKFGDVHREFWLPVGVMHPLIRTPEMNIMGSTFAGEGKEQWFGRMVITSAGGFKIAEISIKKDLENFNKSRTAKNAFETLDVTLGMDDTPMEHMPSPDFYFHRMGVAITFMRMSDMKKPIAHQFKIQRARRDVVMIACKSAHFIIAASPASEFANWRPDLSVKYSHLDIIVNEMHDRKALRGILPELWGLRSMSNRTKSFLEPIYLDGEADEEHSSADSKIPSTTTPTVVDQQRFLAEKKVANPINDVEEDGLRTASREDSSHSDSCGWESSRPLACST